MTYIHLHGFPGTGKSTIVQRLATEFPFNEDEEVFVKYLIECSDSSEDVKKSLSMMMGEMLNCRLTLNQKDCEIAAEQLKNTRTDKFAEIVESAQVPIILIIEDPPEDDFDFLDQLQSSFEERKFRKTVVLCITSRSEVISRNQPAHQHLGKFKVNGLKTSEGLDLLRISQTSTSSERDAAVKIINNLHGSPLGLAVVKATCETSNISYKDYYDEYEQSLDFHHFIKQTVEDEVGPHAKTLFHAIVTLLEGEGLLDTVEILSFFHHGCIPQSLIGGVITRQRTSNSPQSSKTFYARKRESGHFVHRLKCLDICNVERQKSGETFVSFHQMIFLAVQTYMKNKTVMLRAALLSLASQARRNIRGHSNFALTTSLFSHIRSVLDFLASHPMDFTDFVAEFSAIHLQEVYGNTIKYTDSQSAFDVLYKCALAVLDRIQKLSEIEIDIDNLDVSKEQTAIDKFSANVFDACLVAGKQLEATKDAVDEYICIVTHFHPELRASLKTLCTDQEVVGWLSTDVKSSLQVNPKQLRTFRSTENGRMFLDINKYCEVFFVDRLASVLYSLSRVWIYNKDMIEQKRKYFVWLADLVHALCERCSKQTEVALLIYGCSSVNRVNVRISKLSVQNMDDSKKHDLIDEFIEKMKRILEKLEGQNDTVLFENSLRKPLMEADFHKLRCLRCLIRLHTRRIALSSPEENVKLKSSADPYYVKLCTLTDEYLSKWIISTKCHVYCGKYMAALGDFEQAVTHFKSALKGEEVLQNEAYLFPWVCYNYAKAVSAGGAKFSTQVRKDAEVKCNEALKFREIIAKDLVRRLEEQIKLLS